MRFGVSLKAAAAHQRRLAEEAESHRTARFEQAQRELNRAVYHVRTAFACRRIIVWGSMLHPSRFTEMSDLDICVEGIDDIEEWSRLEREVLEMTTLPLHLVRWESLQPLYRRRIMERGEVVYEAN
jgi:predicted nucleotidyltransferase